MKTFECTRESVLILRAITNITSSKGGSVSAYVMDRCRGENQTELIMSPKTPEDTDFGAVMYIIAVLTFYSLGIVVMIVKYLKTERKEMEEEMVLDNFFKGIPDKRIESEKNAVNRVAIHAFHTLTASRGQSSINSFRSSYEENQGGSRESSEAIQPASLQLHCQHKMSHMRESISLGLIEGHPRPSFLLSQNSLVDENSVKYLHLNTTVNHTAVCTDNKNMTKDNKIRKNTQRKPLFRQLSQRSHSTSLTADDSNEHVGNFHSSSNITDKVIVENEEAGSIHINTHPKKIKRVFKNPNNDANFTELPDRQSSYNRLHVPRISITRSLTNEDMNSQFYQTDSKFSKSFNSLQANTVKKLKSSFHRAPNSTQDASSKAIKEKKNTPKECAKPRKVQKPSDYFKINMAGNSGNVFSSEETLSTKTSSSSCNDSSYLISKDCNQHDDTTTSSIARKNKHSVLYGSVSTRQPEKTVHFTLDEDNTDKLPPSSCKQPDKYMSCLTSTKSKAEQTDSVSASQGFKKISNPKVKIEPCITSATSENKDVVDVPNTDIHLVNTRVDYISSIENEQDACHVLVTDL